jgi:hypothetical protein
LQGISGNLFNTSTTSAVTPTPVEGGTQSLTVATGLAYIPGNSVVVIDSGNTANRFEGTVQSYNSGTGALVIEGITSIRGTFGSAVYNVNLDGIDGPTGATGTLIFAGTGAPSPSLGRVGDFYIDLASGLFYGPKQ